MGDYWMKILVCGGRDYSNEKFLFNALDFFHSQKSIDCIVHGACSYKSGGADILAEKWAKLRQIKYIGIPAKWNQEGKYAGPNRNQIMLTTEKPDAIIAFKGGKGTNDMINKAIKAGINVWDLRNKE